MLDTDRETALTGTASQTSEATSWARVRRFTMEVFSFLSVGGIAFIVDVGVSNLLVYGFAGIPALMPGSPIKAKVVSTVVSVAVAWLGNRFWTYGKRASGSSVTGIWRFALVNAIGMVIVVAPLGVSWYLLGLRGPIAYNVATNIIGIGLAMIFRFWAYRTWVFPDRSGERHVIVDTVEDPK